MSAGDDLLARLAPLDLRSRLESPAACESNDGRSLDHPTPLFHHTAAGLFTPIPGMPTELATNVTTDPERHELVAASVAFQSVTGRVATTCFLANAVVGQRLLIEFGDLRWWPDRSSSALGLADVRIEDPAAWDTLIRQLVDDVFTPWVGATRAVTSIGERHLWGNAATSLLVAGTSLQRHGTDVGLADLAPTIAAALPLGDLFVIGEEDGGTEFRRTTCCLIDQAGVTRCHECSLQVDR